MTISPATLRAAKIKLYRQDFGAFATEQLKIKPEQGAVCPLRLDSGQLRLNAVLEKQFKERGYARVITLKGRQSGWSTLSMARGFHMASLTPNYNVLLLAVDEDSTSHVFQMAHLFYDCLDPTIKPDIKYSSKKELVFANASKKSSDPGLRSRMDFQTAKNIMAGTGTTRQALLLSEVAKWLPQYCQDLITSLLPALHPRPGTLLIEESTAYAGGDHFRDMCEKARSGKSSYGWCFSPWWFNNRNTIPLAPGEKIKIKSEERATVNLAKRGQPSDDLPGWEMQPEQIKWWRERRDEFGDLFEQEYPCIAAGQRVGTQRGLIPIEQVVVGDRTEYGTVTAVRCTGTQAVSLVQTRRGYSVVATDKHPLIRPDIDGVRQHPVMVHESAGEQVCLAQPMFAAQCYEAEWWDGCVRNSILVDGHIGRFLGYFMGDGSLTSVSTDHSGCGGSATVSIACDAQDADVVDDVACLMRHLFGEPSMRRVGSKRGGIEVRKGSSVALRLARGLKIYQPAAPHRRVCVPECIWRSPKSVVREFLSGLFEADACKRRARSILLFSKHRKFLEDIQVLLLGFGIESSLATSLRHNKHHSYVANELTLHARATDLFGERVGFISERKAKRFVPSRPGIGRPPIELKGIDRVESVTSFPALTTVYDLSIEGSRRFDANGMLVHNCSFESAWVERDEYVFNSDIMHDMSKALRTPLRYADIAAGPTIRTVRGGERPFADDDYFAIWEEPIPGVQYDIGIDVAAGISGGDWSVAEVIRRDRNEQVAEYHKHIDPVDFAVEMYWLGKYYRNAQLVVEMNNVGLITGNRLSLMAYPYIYIWRHIDRAVPSMSTYAGWKTTYESKKLLIGNTRHIFLHRRMVIRSRVLWDEMRQFIRLDENTYRASRGHDDAIMAYMMAIEGGLAESFGASSSAPASGEKPKVIFDYEQDDRPFGGGPRNAEADKMLRGIQGMR